MKNTPPIKEAYTFNSDFIYGYCQGCKGTVDSIWELGPMIASYNDNNSIGMGFMAWMGMTTEQGHLKMPAD